jgi:hypothetical protein
VNRLLSIIADRRFQSPPLKMNPSNLIPEPVTRSLRIFAFDPSVSAQVDTAGIGVITIGVPWEKLEPGPVGEYIEVVDADPASGCFYHPIDLNDPRVLAQDGLDPLESNPQFHQQMVYAVAMATIQQFEQALGRVALWAPHWVPRGVDPKLPNGGEQFVRRLRIYPHALRDRNAYYSPVKKALLFGYFPVNIKDANNSPGTMVFTCLSHDIIAHETAHALLDGVHPRFGEAVNPDVLAFHEAFADIVALFQHFSYPGVLQSQIARTRGNLATESMLGQLAQQFGKASGRGEALRDALGSKNEKGEWAPRKPDVRELERTSEPHARGAILVAAVFGAFLKSYRLRTADLFRIATGGTGVLNEGDIHPDLAARLAGEAARCAQYILQMCIRAIDYCPPVGITFGTYLRALVTSDREFNPTDDQGYRLAMVESFRQWGIHAEGNQGVSAESLMWPTGEVLADRRTGPGADVHRDAVKELLTGKYASGGGRDVIQEEERASAPSKSATPWKSAVSRSFFQLFREATQQVLTKEVHVAYKGTLTLKPWDLESDRYDTWKDMDRNGFMIWTWLVKGAGRVLATMLGIELDPALRKPTVFLSKSSSNSPATEVHSVRRAVRRTQRGSTVTDLVVEITQRRRGYLDAAVQQEQDSGIATTEEPHDFLYRAGCTLIIDLKGMEIRRVIRTPGTINDDKQLEKLRRFLSGESGQDASNAFDSPFAALTASMTVGSAGRDRAFREPFALLHHHHDS